MLFVVNIDKSHFFRHFTYFEGIIASEQPQRLADANCVGRVGRVGPQLNQH